jgi:hypothetical protein
MSKTDGDQCRESVSPIEVFSLLSNDVLKSPSFATSRLSSYNTSQYQIPSSVYLQAQNLGKTLAATHLGGTVLSIESGKRPLVSADLLTNCASFNLKKH